MNYVLLIILIVVIFIVIALGIAVLWFRNVIRTLYRDYDSREKVIGNGFKNTLVLYQPSKHNSVNIVCRYIVEGLAGKDYKTTINYLNTFSLYSIDNYELIVLVSPVYMGRVSPRIKEFVSGQLIKNKTILLCSVGLILDEVKETDEIVKLIDESNKLIRIKTNDREISKFRHEIEKAL